MGSICCKNVCIMILMAFFGFSYYTFRNAHRKLQIGTRLFKLCISMKYFFYVVFFQWVKMAENAFSFFFLVHFHSVETFPVSVVLEKMFETMSKHSGSIVGYVLLDWEYFIVSEFSSTSQGVTKTEEMLVKFLCYETWVKCLDGEFPNLIHYWNTSFIKCKI